LRQAVKTALADFVTGLLVFALSVSLIINFDYLLSFVLVAVCLAFIGNFYRGRKSTLNPGMTFLLVNLPVVYFTAELFTKVDASSALQTLPLWVMSVLGLYLGRHWNDVPVLRRTILATLPLTAACLYFVLNITSIANTALSSTHDEPSPDFTLTALDGATVTSRSLSGKVVVLNFWAPWCEVCEKGLPEFEKIYDRYRNNPEVAFFAAIRGDLGNTFEQAREFAHSRKFDVPLVYDPEGATFHSFRGPIAQFLVILDKKGQLRRKHFSYFEERDLVMQISEEIDSFLSTEVQGPH
jgi:thiol-disulfide isomerase/thioredoxin